MASTTWQASISYLEARTSFFESKTKELRTELKDLNAKVDRNNDYTVAQFTEVNKTLKALQALMEKLTREHDQPAVSKVLDRGKGIMEEGSGTTHT
ncbi:unnamed protein product [Rhodiola kirilowii]